MRDSDNQGEVPNGSIIDRDNQPSFIFHGVRIWKELTSSVKFYLGVEEAVVIWDYSVV